MMFKKNFIVNIRVNGQILREADGVVTLPFGVEYELYFKNLNSRNVKLAVSIDGSDVLCGDHLLVRANRSTELKGYLNGSTVKNRFRFIQKTKEIADYRGDDPCDGSVRCEYWLEKKIVTERVDVERICNDPYKPILPFYGGNHFDRRYASASKKLRSRSINDGNRNLIGDGPVQANYCSIEGESFDSGCFTTTTSDNLGINDLSSPLENEGITVRGQRINQHFSRAYIGELEEMSSIIILQLKGYTGKQEYVVAPITVKTKIRCETCGKRSKSSAKFCDRCGTSLI